MRFVASALDVRYAFVSAFPGRGGVVAGRLAVWLARDYGLRTDYAEVDVLPGETLSSSLDLLSVLRRGWPQEPELAGVGPEGAFSLALSAGDGRRVGHLGVLDTEGRVRLSSREHLRPLARAAAAELERWARSTC
ncbi:MAG TPA: hypothetical protein VLL75_07840 [Vicinamibacteria bacterium]|nr:hypothetical protein [Vicinamibacteria bacterium]